MDITIVAVIVTFNRKELLLKNIEMCFSQQREIDKIIIIDNHSEDGTRTYIFNKISKANLDKIDYVYLEKILEELADLLMVSNMQWSGRMTIYGLWTMMDILLTK